MHYDGSRPYITCVVVQDDTSAEMTVLNDLHIPDLDFIRRCCVAVTSVPQTRGRLHRTRIQIAASAIEAKKQGKLILLSKSTNPKENNSLDGLRWIDEISVLVLAGFVGHNLYSEE